MMGHNDVDIPGESHIFTGSMQHFFSRTVILLKGGLLFTKPPLNLVTVPMVIYFNHLKCDRRFAQDLSGIKLERNKVLFSQIFV